MLIHEFYTMPIRSDTCCGFASKLWWLNLVTQLGNEQKMQFLCRWSTCTTKRHACTHKCSHVPTLHRANHFTTSIVAQIAAYNKVTRKRLNRYIFSVLKIKSKHNIKIDYKFTSFKQASSCYCCNLYFFIIRLLNLAIVHFAVTFICPVAL